MPAILISNLEQYSRVIEVLRRMGGSWQWIGQDGKNFLLATSKQYQALLDAKAITPENNGKDSGRGKKSRKPSKS